MRDETRARSLLVVTFALFAGCDPGITIRQINSTADPKKKAAVVTPEIMIQVKTAHQLTGEGWYDTEVEVKDSSDSPITITSVELHTQGVTCENKPRAKKTYPLTCLGGAQHLSISRSVSAKECTGFSRNQRNCEPPS